MSLTELTPPKKLRRIYRWEDLPQFTGGVSRVVVYEWIKTGEFPAPIKLNGENGRAVGWFEDQLIAWQESRKVLL